MSRAPWPIGLLFGIALVAIIGLLGPLALFNPSFTSILQDRHDVAEAIGTTPAEVQRLTASFLVDLYTDGAFDEVLEGDDKPFLDASERSHMRDVGALVRTLALVLIGAVVVAAGCGWWMRREPGRIGRSMVVSAAIVGGVALVLAVAFAVAFDAAFTAFHELFFEAGTWQFALGSNLITLFPEPFWFDAALVAGAAILLVAAIVSVVGLWLWRMGRTPPASA
jgi:integral membrane protein (TIGR01906 family)